MSLDVQTSQQSHRRPACQTSKLVILKLHDQKQMAARPHTKMSRSKGMSEWQLDGSLILAFETVWRGLFLGRPPAALVLLTPNTGWQQKPTKMNLLRKVGMLVLTLEKAKRSFCCKTPCDSRASRVIDLYSLCKSASSPL